MTDAADPDGWPNWIGDMRADGDVSVMATTGGTWIVTPADGRPAILACPCCDKPLATKRAAMLIADAVYPPAAP